MLRRSGSRGLNKLARVAAGVAMLTMATSAQAILVQNMTTGEIVFNDDFESASVGSNPTATVGIWDLAVGSSTTLVSDAASPGLHEGAHYLHVSRPQVGETIPDVRPRLFFSAPQNTVGDVINISFATYVPSGPVGIVGQIAGMDRTNYFILDGAGTVNISGANIPSLTAAFENDTWQNWTIEHTVGSATSVWKLDGTEHIQTTAQSLNGISNMLFDLSSLDELYLDSIAEPSEHPGDFDGDGDVDGADFVVWQTNFPKAEGGTLDTGDADGDGDVDGADFVVWQTNFPFTPAAAVVSVPELNSILLLGLGIIGLAALRWRCSI